MADALSDAVSESEWHVVGDAFREAAAESEGVTDADRQSEDDADCDCSTEGEGLGVPLFCAHNGPRLDVARCVPAMEKSGDAVTPDGDELADSRPVTRVGDVVAVGGTDTVGVADSEGSTV